MTTKEIIGVIFLTLQLVFLTGTIYCLTDKGRGKLGDNIVEFASVCLIGNAVCMIVILLSSLYI